MTLVLDDKASAKSLGKILIKLAQSNSNASAQQFGLALIEEILVRIVFILLRV